MYEKETCLGVDGFYAKMYPLVTRKSIKGGHFDGHHPLAKTKLESESTCCITCH